MKYLFAACCVVWVVFFVYLAVLQLRLRSIEKEIRALQNRLRKP